MLGSKIIEQYKKLPENSFVLSSDKSTGKEGGDKFGRRFLIHEVGEDYLSIVDIRHSEVRDLPNSEQVNQHVKSHAPEIAIKITAQAIEDEARYMAVPEYEAVTPEELDKLNSAIQNSDPNQAQEETVTRTVIRATLDTGRVKDRYRKPKQQNESSGSNTESKSTQGQEQSQSESSKPDSTQSSSTSSEEKSEQASSEKPKSANSSLFSDNKSATDKGETGDKSSQSVSSPFSAN